MRPTDAKPNALFSTMEERTPLHTAESLLAAHYGLLGAATALSSERDENFHIAAANGKAYVLKLSHAAEKRGVTDFQTRALLHATARDPTLPIPRLVARMDGAPYGLVRVSHGPERVLRLFGYLPGTPLPSMLRSKAQRRNLGATLARLDRALADFEHPSSGHTLLWDIQHCAQLRPLIAQIPAGPRRDLCERFLYSFETSVRPMLSRVRKQVIHNDLNPYNVLVSPQDHSTTVGLIDFGDLVHAPLINELGVACSYQLSQNTNPLDSAAELLGAYHEVNPLARAEVDLLYDLIAARLVMTVAITGWRARNYPENETYILRNNPLSWDGLERIAKMPRKSAQRFLRQACAMRN